ncbi:MAG: hypothetical protein DMG57_02570 [Acidobacteria bacterium]|nr:MAG: hypothetical protein DMG57_02570 [Acidobacteriota bacterium]
MRSLPTFWLMCSWLAAGGAAQSDLPVVWLRELTGELLRANPDVRAARFRYEASLKRPSQVSTLPEPKFTFTDFGVGHPMSRLSVSDFAYLAFGVSQEMPYPGKLALAGEEAHKQAESEGQAWRAAILEKTTELKVVYYDWFYLSKAIEITKKNRDVLGQFEKISRARYSVGKGIQQDILRAQVERSAIEQQLATLDQQRSSVEAKINSLVKRLPDQLLGQPSEVHRTDFSMDLERLLDLVSQNAPRLRARQFEVDSHAVGIERAKKDYRPDFNFSFQWQKTAAMFPDYYMATAEVRLPVFFWRKQRFAAEEASSRLAESRENYQATRQELLFEAKDEYLKIRTSERLLALYESGILPQSSLALESAMTGYQVGNIDFLTLLNNQTAVLTYQMQYYEQLAKHEQALARLEPLAAMELTKP